MRRSKSCFVLSAVLVAALTAFAFFLQEAHAARTAGGGFSGGTVRGDAGPVQTPRGTGAVEGPRGGAAARGPDGAAVARGPDGGVAVKTPDGAVYTESAGARAESDWDHFYGPGWNGAVDAAPAGGAVGFTDTLPGDATAVVVWGQNYYVSNGVYYQECFMGSDVNYCIVPAPQ